ncbi:amidase family protein [Xanthobacter sp. KR7-65]|uniref:amidase n=1 Tax=Xanthobacter sp. KR7-65 TaxID=3156612 RepID=UPI0032B5F2CB
MGEGSIRRLAAAHAAGRVRVRDTVAEALTRAHAAQAASNCFAAIDDAGAMAAAARIDGEIAAGAAPGPLAGVPVTVKDILDVAGLPTRWGSPLFSDAAPAAADIAAVARLRAAGAIVIGKTTTTEFAHSPLGGSPLTGLTLNPFAPHLTCGGSSSGAGVSAALGVTPVTLATDAGCSSRLPAAATGTYGFKPTLGLVPHERVPDAFGSFIHLGLIARSVADIAATLEVVAGPEAGDPWSQRAIPAPAEGAPLAGRRVLLWMRTRNTCVAPEVEAATREAARVLESLGATVREADYALAPPDPIWSTLQQTNWAMRFAAAPEAEVARLSPALKEGIAAARGWSALDLQRAQVARTRLFRGVQAEMAQVDFILTPCVSAPLVAADFDLAGPLTIDGEAVGPLRAEWTSALSLFDLTGHPAIAVPVGLAANGGPLAVQLVAAWNSDAALLAAAAAFAAVVPAPACPGAYPAL